MCGVQRRARTWSVEGHGDWHGILTTSSISHGMFDCAPMIEPIPYFLFIGPLMVYLH